MYKTIYYYKLLEKQIGGRLMKRKIGILAAIFLVLALCIGMAGSVSAAKTKMIDKGTIKGSDPDLGGYFKFTYVTYQKGVNYIKIKSYLYVGAVDKSVKMTIIMQKVSKTKLKSTIYMNGKKTGTEYDYTKLTASRFYWRVVRPGLLNSI